MTAQIVFVTLFLGIVAGPHPIDLQVTGPVKSVRILIGDHEAARIAGPPWHADIDMGTELAPRELTAVGYDAQGGEIARATQILNLPRPLAELEIVMDGGSATLHSRHLLDIKPVRASMTVDGKPLRVDDMHAKLPKFSPEATHVVAAEVAYGDGYVVRREVVIESNKSYSTGTQLTPIAVRETAEQHPPGWEGCLADRDGNAARVAAVESPEAVVVVVRAPDAHETGSVFNPVLQELNAGRTDIKLPELLLAPNTIERILWPVGAKYGTDPEKAAFLFSMSPDYDASKQEFMHFLMSLGPLVDDDAPLRFADAVAVAGLRAMTGAQRRAVILVLSHKPDASTHSPQAVRRYLASLGVPLFVWSPMSEPPKSGAAWGEVEDVSSVYRLGQAVGRLKRTLAEQRIAWVNVDPLTALRLQANPKCGIEPVARLAP